MSYKNIPNILTVMRMLLVFPCALALLFNYNKTALAIFMIASITDLIDGQLARMWGCQSKLGAVLDPLADKLLIVVLFIVFTIKQSIPMWFASIAVCRELILLSGAAFYRFMFGPVIFIPTMVSKINTCLLLGIIFLSLLQTLFSLDVEQLKIPAVYLCLFTTLYSMLDYIKKWGIRVYKTIQAS